MVLAGVFIIFSVLESRFFFPVPIGRSLVAGEIAAPLEQKSFGYYYDVVQLRILGLKG